MPTSYTLRSTIGSSIVEAQRTWLADSARQERRHHCH